MHNTLKMRKDLQNLDILTKKNNSKGHFSQLIVDFISSLSSFPLHTEKPNLSSTLQHAGDFFIAKFHQNGNSYAN